MNTSTARMAAITTTVMTQAYRETSMACGCSFRVGGAG
jgi:hypothetical protein